MIKETSVKDFIQAIKKLPPHETREAWIRWLGEYDEAGYYNRKPGMNYSAKFSYNHMAGPQALLWLIQAAGVNKELVKLAQSDCDQLDNVHQKCAAIRKRVPWTVLELTLWKPSR